MVRVHELSVIGSVEDIETTVWSNQGFRARNHRRAVDHPSIMGGDHLRPINDQSKRPNRAMLACCGPPMNGTPMR
jgi:hypothetical protein